MTLIQTVVVIMLSTLALICLVIYLTARQTVQWWRCRECGMCFNRAGEREMEPEGVVSEEYGTCGVCTGRHWKYEKHKDKINGETNRG
mgnify:CR=1 FL=1